MAQKGKQRRTRQERGQITILVATMITTFLLFFMFVVNVGMLVNAKINLQNAADLAAYAGAATQARLLNEISFLNYEMRRQYKKFLFRYHVLGNMAQKVQPAQAAGCVAATQADDQNRIWTPTGCQGDDLEVPSICMIFNHNDNFCQITHSPHIALPAATSGILDGITGALKSQLQSLEQIREQKCFHIGRVNLLVANLWLFNADPDVSGIVQQSAGGDPEQHRDFQTVQVLAHGLGLLPRETILTHRINTLEYYVNFPPQQGVTAQKLNDLVQAKDPGGVERVAQAFFSAAKTLGPAFDPEEGAASGSEGLELTELLPSGGEDGANLLRLNRISTDFDVYYLQPDPGTPDSDGGRDCLNVPHVIHVKNMIMGFSKDLTVLTYYALRLKANARVLFSPFGDVTLKAYSAAMPFGSRIGPQLTATDFRKQCAKPNQQVAGGFLCPCNVCVGTANLPVTAGDSTDSGWWKNQVINAFFTNMRPPPPPGDPGQPLGLADFEKAYGAAMVPNPFEKGKFNILNDLGASNTDPFNGELGNPFMRFFSAKDTRPESFTYSFWAPIVSADKGGAGGGGLQQSMEQTLHETLDTIPEAAPAIPILSQAMSTYVNGLSQGRGEDGETFSVVRLQDPLRMINPLTRQTESVSGLPPSVIMNNPHDFVTSWNDAKDQTLTDRGRIGYSVKFVSFKSLISKQITSDGTTPMTNDMPTDVEPDSGDDLRAIRH
jgi:hypothetical protein